MIYHRGSMFKLSSCIAVCRGRYFPSLSFCFDYSASSAYRWSTVWVVECNSRSLMQQFSSSEQHCSWKCCVCLQCSCVPTIQRFEPNTVYFEHLYSHNDWNIPSISIDQIPQKAKYLPTDTSICILVTKQQMHINKIYFISSYITILYFIDVHQFVRA